MLKDQADKRKLTSDAKEFIDQSMKKRKGVNTER